MDLATTITQLQTTDNELKDDFAQLAAKLDDEGAQITALNQQIADLLAQGSGATAEQLAALGQVASDLDTIHQSAKTHLPTPPPPAPFQNVRLTTDTTFEDGYQVRLWDYNQANPDNQVPESEFLTHNADGTGTWDTMVPEDPAPVDSPTSDPTGGAAALGTDTSNATSKA